jgi:hypothetical protein
LQTEERLLPLLHPILVVDPIPGELGYAKIFRPYLQAYEIGVSLTVSPWFRRGVECSCNTSGIHENHV